MKKYIIEIESVVRNTGELFDSRNYERTGFYKVEETGTAIIYLLFVDKTLQVTYPVLTQNYASPSMCADIRDFAVEYEEPKELPKAELLEMPAIVQGVSEQTLLRAIAIVQKPELAIRLTEDDRPGED